MDVISLPNWENKDDRVKIIDIGSTVGFKPTTTKLKSGPSSDRAKQSFNMAILTLLVRLKHISYIVGRVTAKVCNKKKNYSFNGKLSS